jgi:hypothetical protein
MYVKTCFESEGKKFLLVLFTSVFIEMGELEGEGKWQGWMEEENYCRKGASN